MQALAELLGRATAPRLSDGRSAAYSVRLTPAASRRWLTATLLLETIEISLSRPRKLGLKILGKVEHLDQ
jgi:hypothetical protein